MVIKGYKILGVDVTYGEENLRLKFNKLDFLIA
jgi:hypothetical protein